MANYSCHWLTTGKMKTGICCSHCRYFDKTFAEVFPKWSCTTHTFFVVTSTFIGYHDKRQNLRKKKKKKKSTPQKLCWRDKLKLCRTVSKISHYKTVFLLPLLKHFGCYGNLNFPLTYKRKSENWDVVLSHCRYFDKNYFITLSAYHFSPNLSIWLLPWQPKN